MNDAARSQRLYVYYRLPAARLPDVTEAARAMQAALAAEYPQLRIELLQRADPGPSGPTLMESYAGELTPGFRRRLAEAAADLPQPRHEELFEPCPAGAPGAVGAAPAQAPAQRESPPVTARRSSSVPRR